VSEWWISKVEMYYVDFQSHLVVTQISEPYLCHQSISVDSWIGCVALTFYYEALEIRHCPVDQGAFPFPSLVQIQYFVAEKKVEVEVEVGVEVAGMQRRSSRSAFVVEYKSKR
jgi:hypothetical protein